QELLTGLDPRTVGEAIRLNERRERHPVALGDAKEGIAFLHLDGFAARWSPRAIDRSAGVALASGCRLAGGCGRIVAHVGEPLACAGAGRRKARAWQWVDVEGRRSTAPGFAKASAARRSARGILIAAPSHGFRRHRQRTRFASLVG